MDSLDIRLSDGEAPASSKLYYQNDIAFSSEDFTRVIMQSLHNLGYIGVAEQLEKESGLRVRSSHVDDLFRAIVSGNWKETSDMVATIDFVVKTKVDVKAMVAECKFLEMIQQRQVESALLCLRTELRSSCSPERLKLLSACLLCAQCGQAVQSLDAGGAELLSSRDALLREVKKYISPAQIVRETRLEDLVAHALRQQRALVHTAVRSTDTVSHRSNVPVPMSLLEDYESAVEAAVEGEVALIPHSELLALRDHADEVWCVSFSLCGKYLASGSVDGTVRVWCCDGNTWGVPSVAVCLEGLPQHSKPTRLAWSSSSTQLLCCCEGDAGVYRWEAAGGAARDGEDDEEGRRLWEGALCMRYTHHECALRDSEQEDDELSEVKCAEWVRRLHQDGHYRSARDEYFVSLSDDFRIMMCDVGGEVLASWNGIGVASAMTVLPPLEGSRHPTLPEDTPQDWTLHGHRPSGWVTVSASGLGSASGNESVRGYEGNGSAVGEAVDDDSGYPVGARFLVVRSEVYVELYELQAKPSGSSTTDASGTAETRSAVSFVFVAVAHVECASPIISMSPSQFLDPAANAYTLLLGLFGGEILSLTVQSDNGLSRGEKYRGLTQGRYVIVPALGGGKGGAVVASGGDAANVLIWREGEEMPVCKLKGHGGPVNDVCWSPTHRGVLASASDDHTIRFWCPSSMARVALVEEGIRQVAVEESKEDSCMSSSPPTTPPNTSQLSIYHSLFSGWKESKV